MSLADSIAAQKIKTKGPRCSAGAFLGKISDEDAADFVAALGGDVQLAVIARALKAHYEGSTIDPPGQEALRRHRSRECKCAQ